MKCYKIVFDLIYLQNIRDVAQPGSVLAWGARGRWFESSHPDFFKSLSSQLQNLFLLNLPKKQDMILKLLRRFR
jgi:hypothetical protein